MSKHDFKRGDKVQCADVGSQHGVKGKGTASYELELGGVYTVKDEVSDTLIQVEEVDHRWFADRFIPYETDAAKSEEEISEQTPRVLTVVLADTQRTRDSIVYEEEHLPYRRRTVQIELAPEQRAKIELRKVGSNGVEPIYEEIAGCWLEPIDNIEEEA